MSASFFFYDLETSGFNAKSARIMQFAGQRTSLGLKPIGESINELIRLTPDVLPDPGAILVTGITPQKTLEEGLSEAEFLSLFYEQVAKPDTIFIGYNSVRFDDEFMRYLNWRNFYDPYEWQWKDGRSRWDLLDVIRLTRALRPDGIKWPKDSEGRPTNRLELLTQANRLEHSNSHDALSDVGATIALARLIKTTQPKLFDYLLQHRDKDSVEQLVNLGQPFVYASGKYPAEFEKTSVVVKLTGVTGGALVYDLRCDPSEFIQLTPEKLAKRWQFTKEADAPSRLPVKTMKFNRCPAIAPLGTLDPPSQKRIKLELKTVEANLKKLAAADGFAEKVAGALKLLDQARERKWSGQRAEAEGQLYDNFISDADKSHLEQARSAGDPPNFSDNRLAAIWPRYKARNYPKRLSGEEREDWDSYCRAKLTDGGENSRLANYFKLISELQAGNPGKNEGFLLDELLLYGESLMPIEV